MLLNLLINNVSKVLLILILFKLSLFQFDIIHYTENPLYIFNGFYRMFYYDMQFLIYYTLIVFCIILLFNKFKITFKYFDIISIFFIYTILLLNLLSIYYLNRNIELYDIYNFSFDNFKYLFSSLDYKIFLLFIIPFIIIKINFNKFFIIIFFSLILFSIIINVLFNNKSMEIYKENYVAKNIFINTINSLFYINKYIKNIDEYNKIKIKNENVINIPNIDKSSNVFIFSLESVNYKYFTKENSPFLYSLIENSINFKNLYSNFSSTKDSLTSLYYGNDTNIFSIKNSNKLYNSFDEDPIINKFKNLNYKINFTTSGIASLNNSYFNNKFFNKHTNFIKDIGSEDIKYNSEIYHELYYLDRYINNVKENEINGYLTSITHWPYYTLNNEETKDLTVENYIKSIKTQDQVFKEIFEKYPVLKNSTILFVADHGQGFNEHNFLTHGEFYNEVLHIPAFIYNKNLKQIDIEDYYSTINLLPTLYSLLSKEVIENSIFDKNMDKYIISNNILKVIFINKETKEKYFFDKNNCYKFDLLNDYEEKIKLNCDDEIKIKEMFNHIKIRD